MARVIGIDPGTVSFDLCGLEDGQLFLDRSLPTADVTGQPESLVDLLAHAMPVDLIAGPSGYGLPLVAIDRLTDRDIILACLPRDPGQTEGVVGLRRVFSALQIAHLPVVFREELSRFAPVRVVSGFARVAKEAAQGAALIADGLAGGSRRGLVEGMQIQNASGTVFDNLFVAGAEQLVQRLAE